MFKNYFKFPQQKNNKNHLLYSDPITEHADTGQYIGYMQGWKD